RRQGQPRDLCRMAGGSVPRRLTAPSTHDHHHKESPMSSTQASQVSALLDGLASGAVQVVDLTQPLSETTPVIQLPPPFANTPGLSREEISKYDDRGPAWAWYTLTIGEHVGTHVDAPIHWVTGQDGNDVASIDATQPIGPACGMHKAAETEAHPGYR